jgi:FtsH-binding integral membrane protein
MYKRIFYEDWHTVVPLLAFAATVFVFVLMSLRGLTLSKDHAKHMSKLPLDD